MTRGGSLSKFPGASFYMSFLRRRFRIALLIFLVVIITGFLFRHPLMRAAASGWVVDEPPTKAAAIVVLGGSPESRPFAAAKLFHDGYAPKVLLPRVKPGPAVALGLKANDTEIARAVLIHEGVPESAIELIGTDVSSTFEETQAVKTWLKDSAEGSPATILIPTETFFTRRTRWIFQKTLDTSATARVVAIPAAGYTTSDWWEHEEGLIDFQNEVIKHLYYHLKY